MTEWIATIVQRSLRGGLYALFAIGLSITYGVVRVVNITDGEFIVLASYLDLIPISMLGGPPLSRDTAGGGGDVRPGLSAAARVVKPNHRAGHPAAAAGDLWLVHSDPERFARNF